MGKGFWENTWGSINDTIDYVIENPIASTLALPTGGLSVVVDKAMDSATEPEAPSGVNRQPIISEGNLADAALENLVSAEEQLETARKIAEENLARMPRIAETARGVAKSTASDLDKYMSDRFFSNLEAALPDYREQTIDVQRDALTSVKGVADAFIKGELPDDLKSFIERTRAEQNLGQGRFGEQARSAVARDLGLTSLDLINRGTELQTNAVSPLSSRLLSTAFSLTPPVSDPQALFGQAMGIGAGASTINPGQAMSMAAQVGLANAQMAWAGQLSQANMEMDMWQTQMQAQMQAEAIQAQQQNSLMSGLFSLGGTILGAAVAGPVGAAVGGGAGSMLGGTMAAQTASSMASQVGTSIGGFGINPMIAANPLALT